MSGESNNIHSPMFRDAFQGPAGSNRRPRMSPAAAMRYAGGSGAGGRASGSVGGPTWEMNSFAPDGQGDPELFQGPSQWQAGFGGGHGGARSRYAGMQGAGDDYPAANAPRPGRIGYRGEAPPAATTADYERSHGGGLSGSHSDIGGLTDFYASRAKDPYTGLSLNPSSFERMQQRALLEKKDMGDLGTGDFQGLAAVDSYNRARAGGDPGSIYGAGRTIEAIRNQRLQNSRFGLNQGQQQTPDEARFAKQFGSENSGSPAIVDGQVQQNQGFQTGGEIGSSVAGGINNDSDLENGSPIRNSFAMGGAASRMHPYLVGEEGPEAYVTKDGDSQMIGENGPEVRSFPKPGNIIPNNRLPAKLRLAGARAGGGFVKGSRGLDPYGENYVDSVPRSISKDYVDSESDRPDVRQFYARNRAEGLPYRSSAPERSSIAARYGVPIPMAPQEEAGLEEDVMDEGPADESVSQIPAFTQSTEPAWRASARERLGFVPGVDTSIPQANPNALSYETPYGRIGVSHGTGPVHSPLAAINAQMAQNQSQASGMGMTPPEMLGARSRAAMMQKPEFQQESEMDKELGRKMMSSPELQASMKRILATHLKK